MQLPTNSNSDLGNKNLGLGPSVVVLHLEKGNVEILGALRSLSREAGDQAGALRYARQLAGIMPDNANLGRLLAELEGTRAEPGEQAMLGFELDIRDCLMVLTRMPGVAALIVTRLFLAGLPGSPRVLRSPPGFPENAGIL